MEAQSLRFVIVKNDQNSGDPKKGLPEDLQNVYDGLASDAIIFFNNLKR
jgi:hypothetical protein